MVLSRHVCSASDAPHGQRLPRPAQSQHPRTSHDLVLPGDNQGANEGKSLFTETVQPAHESEWLQTSPFCKPRLTHSSRHPAPVAQTLVASSGLSGNISNTVRFLPPKFRSISTPRSPELDQIPRSAISFIWDTKSYHGDAVRKKGWREKLWMKKYLEDCFLKTAKPWCLWTNQGSYFHEKGPAQVWCPGWWEEGILFGTIHQAPCLFCVVCVRMHFTWKEGENLNVIPA